MELTRFGREVRKLRIEKDMLLKGMADALGVSPSWLSALETGRKNIPAGFVRKMAQSLHLSDDEHRKLAEAAALSRIEYSIKPGNDPLRRDVAAELARRFDELGEDELRELQAIVRRRS